MPETFDHAQQPVKMHRTGGRGPVAGRYTRWHPGGGQAMTEEVLLFGATRATGFEVARILAGRGESVTAVVRPGSEDAPLRELGVNVLAGDVMDPASVQAAFAAGTFRAVISTVGGRRGEQPRPDLDGIRHVIEAARSAGVSRMLMVTMIGAGDSATAVAPKVHEMLGEAIAAKSAAEELLVSSGLDYTILRPGGMSSDPATGTAILSDDHQRMGVITRADLAALLVRCLDDPASIGCTWHAVDPEIRWTPPLQRGEGLTGKRH